MGTDEKLKSIYRDLTDQRLLEMISKENEKNLSSQAIEYARKELEQRGIEIPKPIQTVLKEDSTSRTTSKSQTPLFDEEKKDYGINKSIIKSKETDSISSLFPGINKVVNVTLVGGIIGMLAGSPNERLNKVIEDENRNGWKVIQIIPSDQGNVFISILRFILLIVTIFLFTTTNGYYVIMEKMK